VPRLRALAPVLPIVIASTALSVVMLTGDHDWGDDFAAYILQAVSIVRGTERQEIARAAFAVQQSSHYFGPVATPWGFPALLAAAYAACGGLDIFCLKLVSVPFFALFVAVFFQFLRRRLPAADAAMLTSVLAMSPVLLAFQNNVLSDIAFLFFSTLALLLIDIVIVRPCRAQGSPGGNVALGAGAFFAFFVRANGALLLPTLLAAQVAVFLRDRSDDAGWRRRAAIGAVPYAVFALLAAAVAIVFPTIGLSDASHYRVLTAARLRENIAAYVIIPSVFFWPIPLYELFYGGLIPFLVCGVVWHWRDDVHVIVYSGLTLLLFVLWPEQQGLRYMFPILPFFVYFCFRGMKASAFALTERYRRAGDVLTRAVWAGVLLMFVLTSIRLAVHPSTSADGPFAAASSEMFEWVKRTTTRGDVVIFDKPRLMRLITDRDAIMIDRCDQLARGRYVVLRKQGGEVNQIAPEVIGKCDPELELMPSFSNEQYLMYRVVPRRRPSRVGPG
jgi:hypothetical protein